MTDRTLRVGSALALAAATALAAPAFAADLVVNEIDYDQDGTDAAEYVELKNTSGGDLALDAYRLELVNGSNGSVYVTVALPATTLAADDYFVVCADPANTPNCDVDSSPDTNWAQNGAPDAVRIVRIADDGVEDALSYEGDVPGASEGGGTPLADANADDNLGLSRTPDGADTDDNAADFALRCITPGTANSTESTDCPPPTGTPTEPTLSIADAAMAEGGTGSNPILELTVTLTGDAGESVAVDFATADGSATAGVDYVATSGTLNFAGTDGETQTIEITLNGDDDEESDETFTVTLSNVVSVATVVIGDGEAAATIANDDLTVVSIGAVQGAGATSPFDGDEVTVVGIVTAIDSNGSGGFWVQEPAPGDGDDQTSDGIFVFDSALAGTLTLGQEVQVTGTVAEYVPGADPNQLPLTELTSPSAVVLNPTPQALPAPVDLSLPANRPTPDGGLGQLERFEGMRVVVPELRVVAPSDGDELFGVIGADTARPFREPGVDAHDPLPPGSPANVPVWDANPETLRIKSRILDGGAFLDARAGGVLLDLIGVLDYGFRRYTVLPDPGDFPTLQPGSEPDGEPVSMPDTREVVIGGFNVENLSNAAGDFDDRAAKLSIAIREFLHLPDMLGLIEVRDLATLQDLAARIGADAVDAGMADPMYQAILLGDGTQEVGLLYRGDEVAPGIARVSVAGATEIGADLELLCPGGTSTGDPLNDRPPLVVDATVRSANGAALPVTVIVVHLKSLIDVDSDEAYDPGSPFECFGTVGARNRAKRQQGAEFLAAELQARQVAPVVVVGDFNAFEFNDGYADVMGAITGMPAEDDETVQPDDGEDQVDPDLFNLVVTAPEGSDYSYVFEGNAQILDHVLVNQAMLDATSDARVEFAHINADYLDFADGNDATTALRGSDHDPAIGFFRIVGFGIAPTIEPIADQETLEERATDPIAVTIADADEALVCAHALFVEADVAGFIATIEIDGSEPDCTLVITPAVDQVGTATVTVTVTDTDGASASTQFELRVRPDADGDGVIDMPIFGDGFESAVD